MLGLGLILLLLRPLASPERTLIYRDNLHYTVPLNHLIRATLLEGRLHEWDPTQFAGVPFLANPSSQALYPPRWGAVLATKSSAKASDLFALLHFCLALFGGVAFGRELGLKRGPRRLLAVTYTLGGPMLSLLGNLVYLVGAAWLPLSLAWILRARRKAPQGGWPFASAVALAGVGLTPPLYGGDPQTSGWLALLAVVVLLAPGGARPAPPRRRLLGLLALGATTFLLSLALLLPAALLTGETTRGVGLHYSVAGRWSFHPGRLCELLFAHPFGLPFPERGTYVGGALEPQVQDFWSHTFFLGAGLLLFVIRGLGPLPQTLRRARTALIVLSLLALVLAFGRHTPIHPWLASHTPYGIFRYPEKHLTLIALALAGLAGIGLQAWLASAPWRDPKRLLPFLALPVLALLLVSPLSAWTASLAEVKPPNPPAAFVPPRPPSLGGQALSALLVQVWLLGILALPRLGPRRRATLVVIGVALTSLSVLDRLAFVGHASLVEEPPASVQAFREHVPAGPLPPRLVRDPPGEAFGTYPSGYMSSAEVGALLTQATLASANCAYYDFHGLLGMTGFNPRRFAKLKEVTPQAAFWERCAVAYVVAPLSGRRARRSLINVGLEIGLYPRPARPRVELVSDVHWVSDEAEAWASLADVSTRVVVAVGPGQPSSETRSLGSARALATNPSDTASISLATSAPSPALLVVRDAWFPGWEATVDGQETPIHLVDGVFMGIPVPAGDHAVELRYETPGFRLGALISGLAWLGVLGVLLLGRLRRQRALPT